MGDQTLTALSSSSETPCQEFRAVLSHLRSWQEGLEWCLTWWEAAMVIFCPHFQTFLVSLSYGWHIISANWPGKLLIKGYFHTIIQQYAVKFLSANVTMCSWLGWVMWSPLTACLESGERLSWGWGVRSDQLSASVSPRAPSSPVLNSSPGLS